MPAASNVLIIGGGFASSALAVLLRKHDVAVTLAERAAPTDEAMLQKILAYTDTSRCSPDIALD